MVQIYGAQLWGVAVGGACYWVMYHLSTLAQKEMPFPKSVIFGFVMEHINIVLRDVDKRLQNNIARLLKKISIPEYIWEHWL